MLSKNFSLRELTKSQNAVRAGIPNIPTEEVIANLKKLAENVLQKIRDNFKKPVSVSSAYRCLVLNRLIGSKDTSDHVKGEAADIEIEGVSNYDLAKWIVDNCEFNQLILEFYTPGDPNSGWVHVSYKEGNNKNEVLTAVSIAGGTVYLKGLVL